MAEYMFRVGVDDNGFLFYEVNSENAGRGVYDLLAKKDRVITALIDQYFKVKASAFGNYEADRAELDQIMQQAEAGE